MFTKLIGLVTIVVFFAIAYSAGAESLLDNGDFLSGVTTKGVITVEILNDIGANSICLFLRWGEIEPKITSHMTVEEVEREPGLIDDFILSHNWEAFDNKIQPFVDAGINVFVIIGSGFSCDIPLFEGQPATPDRLGRESYLGHIFLFASAAARRYKDKVKGLVLEDELNEAALTSLFGWRSPSPLIAESLWSDFGFLTELIATLSRAVRSEAPDVLVLINFHTDIHPNFHSISSPELRRIVGGKNWIESAVAWQDYMDVVALDSFPNYYIADPVYGSDIGDKVAEIKSSLPDKPVIVLSTAYSVPRDGENPSPVNWTEAKQDSYLNEAIMGSLEAGARGFFYFDLAGQGCKPPPGGYTEKDLLALGKIGPPFRSGDLTAFMIAILDLGLDYIQGRFVEVIQGAEGFGFMRPDGSKRQAYYTIREWYKDISLASQSSFEINLAQGWNLISLPLKPSDTDPDAVLSSIAGLYNSVWAYDPIAGWSIYAPGAPSDLEEIVPCKGYWIKMDETGTLIIQGTIPEQTVISLTGNAWNLVGYSSLESRNAGECMSSVVSDINSVWEYGPNDAVVKSWSIYAPGAPSDLEVMKPGYGYWIKADRSCDCDINAPITAAPPLIVESRRNSVAEGKPIIPYRLWGNVEVNGVNATNGGIEHHASMVALKVDNEVQNCYTLHSVEGYSNRYMLDIPANTDNRAQAELYVQIGDELIRAAPVLPGEPGQVIRLDLSVRIPSKVNMLLQNYPNPFNPDTWIPYQLKEDSNVEIRIYSATGQLVRTLNLGHKPVGFYTDKNKAAYWNGKNEAGEQVASGIYFYAIQAGRFIATRKMILMK